jgi:hypothetical protein
LELFGVTLHMDPPTIEVNYAPDEGQLAKSIREGEPSEHMQAIFQIANETAVLRASQVPDAPSEEWGSRLFLPASRYREIAALAAEANEGREFVYQMATLKTNDRETV